MTNAYVPRSSCTYTLFVEVIQLQNERQKMQRIPLAADRGHRAKETAEIKCCDVTLCNCVKSFPKKSTRVSLLTERWFAHTIYGTNPLGTKYPIAHYLQRDSLSELEYEACSKGSSAH